jgi:hypothetical protein
MFSTQNFRRQGPKRDPPDFPLMPNTGNFFLRNHFQGKYFMTRPERVSFKFWAGPNQVLGESKWGLEPILVKWLGLGLIPIKLWEGPIKSRATLSKVRRFEDEML